MKFEKKKYFHRYLPIPRQLVQSELATIGDAELRVYLYLLHRTIGYGKLSDAVFIEEISGGIKSRSGSVVDVGTGLKRSTVKRAVKSLESSGWIEIIREHNKPSKYTVSKFLRVQKLTVKDPSRGSAGEPSDGPLANPLFNKKESRTDGAAEKVVQFAKRRP